MRNIIQMLLRVSERSLPRESKRLVVLSDETSHIVRNEHGGTKELVEKLIRVIPLILKHKRGRKSHFQRRKEPAQTL